MTLDSYIESLRGKSIAVIGLGVSNRPLLRLLLDAGYAVTVRDKRTEEKFGADEAAALEKAGCRLVLGEGYLSDLSEDVIFRTPGLHPFTPELAAAKERGAVLTSEMEAFFAVCPCRIIAVTGSDGKTTTTTILSELLKAQGYRVFLGGNIGTPLLDKAPEMHPGDWAVLELSSFQLHSMDCRPDIAVVTNVSPNHLDVHPSYEDYQTAKKQIFLSQNGGDVTVLNADNAITRAFAVDCPGTVRFFSRESEPENGVFLRGGEIFRSRGGEVSKLMDAASIRLPGLHNVENYMAAFAATDGIVSDDTCRAVAESCPEDVVIGCDTVVDVDGAVFGKPADRDDARRMIRVLAGRGHLVHTGVCIAAQGRELCFAATTKVVFGALSDAEIEAYIATDDPYDKAGAYGVQNGAAKFVAGIEGCYFNVMGFPVSRVYNALKELDVL